MSQPEQFTFFWGGPFSQWFKAAFTIDGQVYNTAEQYMMAEKARQFGDEETRAKILKSNQPDVQKRLGREVKGFDSEIWNVIAREIVYQGNRAKFTTHGDLLQMLFDTQGTSLVEASPTDKIWGIGLAADAEDAKDRLKWLGTNWLGEVLQRVRDDLLEESPPRGIPDMMDQAAREQKTPS